MAEARREVEEGQRRDLRDVRNRPRATGMFANVASQAYNPRMSLIVS